MKKNNLQVNVANDNMFVPALIATFGDVNAAVERLLALGQLSMS